MILIKSGVNLLEEDEDQLPVNLALDYVLILVIGSPTRDYKEFDGHSWRTHQMRDQRSNFSRVATLSCQSEIE